METKQARFIRKWKKLQKQGKWRYIFIHGSAIWGIVTSIITRIIFDIMDHRFTLNNFENPEYLKRFFISILVFMVMGIPFGYWLWKQNENRFQKLTGKN